MADDDKAAVVLVDAKNVNNGSESAWSFLLACFDSVMFDMLDVADRSNRLVQKQRKLSGDSRLKHTRQ